MWGCSVNGNLGPWSAHACWRGMAFICGGDDISQISTDPITNWCAAKEVVTQLVKAYMKHLIPYPEWRAPPFILIAQKACWWIVIVCATKSSKQRRNCFPAIWSPLLKRATFTRSWIENPSLIHCWCRVCVQGIWVSYLPRGFSPITCAFIYNCRTLQRHSSQRMMILGDNGSRVIQLMCISTSESQPVLLLRLSCIQRGWCFTTRGKLRVVDGNELTFHWMFEIYFPQYVNGANETLVSHPFIAQMCRILH